MLKLHILASGSRGNAAVVENATTDGVLIDCGICKRDFFTARCGEAGFDPAKLDAIAITHEHGDHTKGLGVVMRRLAKIGRRPAVYAAVETLRASKPLQEADRRAPCALAPDSPRIGSGAFRFSLPPPRTTPQHRSGFRIEANGDAAGFMTDTGIVGSEAHAHLENDAPACPGKATTTKGCCAKGRIPTRSSSASPPTGGIFPTRRRKKEARRF